MQVGIQPGLFCLAALIFPGRELFGRPATRNRCAPTLLLVGRLFRRHDRRLSSSDVTRRPCNVLLCDQYLVLRLLRSVRPCRSRSANLHVVLAGDSCRRSCNPTLVGSARTSPALALMSFSMIAPDELLIWPSSNSMFASSFSFRPQLHLDDVIDVIVPFRAVRRRMTAASSLRQCHRDHRCNSRGRPFPFWILEDVNRRCRGVVGPSAYRCSSFEVIPALVNCLLPDGTLILDLPSLVIGRSDQRQHSCTALSMLAPP